MAKSRNHTGIDAPGGKLWNLRHTLGRARYRLTRLTRAVGSAEKERRMTAAAEEKPLYDLWADREEYVDGLDLKREISREAARRFLEGKAREVGTPETAREKFLNLVVVLEATVVGCGRRG